MSPLEFAQPTPHKDDSQLDSIIDQCTERIKRGRHSQLAAKEAKTRLLAWKAKAVQEARVDELERLYLVYGSKDNPASLDNLFSLGKKGEVCATPIQERLAALQANKEPSA